MATKPTSYFVLDEGQIAESPLIFLLANMKTLKNTPSVPLVSFKPELLLPQS